MNFKTILIPISYGCVGMLINLHISENNLFKIQLALDKVNLWHLYYFFSQIDGSLVEYNSYGV